MKKRLLLAALAAFGMMNTYAYNDGDFVYTRNGKFQIQGENLLPSDLSQFKTVWGTTLNADTFEVSNAGPNGAQSIKVKSTATKADDAMGESANIFMSVPREAGQYYLLTYKVKGYAAASRMTNCPNTGRNGNYQAFFANNDGTTLRTAENGLAVSSDWLEYYNTGWQEMAFDYLSAEAGYVNMLFYNLLGNDEFSEIGIYKVAKVGDDRKLKDIKVQLEYFKNNPAVFPDNEGFLAGFSEAVDEMLSQPGIGVEDVDAMVAAYYDATSDGALTGFFDAFSVDVSNYFTNFTFDEVGTGSKKVASGWTSSVGTDRWGIKGPDYYMLTNHVMQDIGQRYDLQAADYYQEVDLPAGQYMLMVKAQAYGHMADGSGSKSNYYIQDFSKKVEGMQFFINDQVVTMDVPTWKDTTYILVADLPAGPKKVGFHSPGSTDKRGGHYKFDNVQLRLLHADQNTVNEYFYKAKVEEARNALKVMIDSANVVKTKEDYLFEKSVLVDSIALSQAVYDNAAYAAPSEENVNINTEQMRYMRAAINAYYTINAEYTQLRKDLQTCKNDIQDQTRPKAKDAFQAAITTADNYVKAQTETSRDSLALVNQDAALMAARNKYMIANATYNTPADLYLVNNSFQSKDATGWTVDKGNGDEEDSKGVWKFGSDNAFTDGYCIYFNRGYTAGNKKYAWQEVDITESGAGVYEFNLQAAVHNQRWSDIQPTDAYIYIGNDSLEVCTKGPGSNDQIRGEVAPFKVRTVVENPAALTPSNTLRLGFEKMSDKQVTMIYLGSCHLLYYGPYDAYLKDSIAAVIQPTRDSLQLVINEHNEIYTTSRNPNGVDVSAYNNAIQTAQGVCSNEASTIEQLNAQFALLEDARRVFVVSGVWPAKDKFFDLSFLIQNGDFSDETADWAGWTQEGAPMGIGTEGYLTLYFGKDATSLSTKLTQTVNNLPKGKFQFAMYATYRTGLAGENVWDVENYAEGTNTFANIVANDVVAPVTGLLSIGQAGENNTWVYNAENVMTNYDYRHTAPCNDYFRAGLFNNFVTFDVADSKSATVGFDVQNIKTASWFFAKKPQLYYWGDEVTLDIEDAIIDNNVVEEAGDIYTVSGIKVRSNATSTEGLAKGIYVKNGKKFVVK